MSIRLRRIGKRNYVVVLMVALGSLILFQVNSLASTHQEVARNTRQLLSLDGTWEIIFDPQNEGRSAGWHQEQAFGVHNGRRAISVPSHWEEIEQDYEGVAFYGKRFSVPETWKGKTVRLQFDAVNYIAEVWVNDRVAGRHEGGYGPFEMRVDDLLKYQGDNFLSLRVIGPIVARDTVIDGMGKNDMPHWRGAITGGIWQSVRLVATGAVFVDDVFVVPQLKDNTAHVQVTLENTAHTGRNVDAEVAIYAAQTPSQAVARASQAITLVPGTKQAEWALTIHNARYWSPDDPYLYSAVISVGDDDQISVRFGLRELTIRNRRFELNGQPIYLKAAFFEGLYPTRLAFPDSEAMAKREIQLAKECGFNVIRPWRKPPPPMWLDLCDEMGVMVIGTLPVECMDFWPTITPHLRERIENEVYSAVLRDRNRACTVQWEIFNEIVRPDLGRLKHPMSMLARRLDPTRLILDESGGWVGGAGMYLPGQFEPEVFNDVHSYPGAPLNDVSYDYYLAISKTPEELEAMGLKPGRFTASMSKPGHLSVVSEIGYGSLPDLVDNNARFARNGNPLVPPYRYHMQMAHWIRDVLKESGLDAVYPDLQQFCLDQQMIHSEGNKRMIEAIRSNASIGGYAVHALTGGDWVLGAGLLDLFRNPKRSYWGAKEANQPRYLALRVRPRNIYAARGARITITGINDLDAVSGTLSVDIVSADDRSVFQTEEQVSLVSGISNLLDEKLETGSMAGSYTVRAQLTGKDGVVVARNEVTIDVFPEQQLTAPKAKIAVLDVNNSLRPLLERFGIPFVEFSANTPESLPVFVARAAAPNPRAEARFRALEKFVQQGGTAVYLETVRWGARELPSQVLPIHATAQQASGLWVGVSHIVTDHAVFKGLPTNCMMGQAYENVFAPLTLIGTGGELIVGSVSHGWHKGKKGSAIYKDNMHYQGPSAAWYGMDLGVVPHGRGRYVLSVLRIVENLGKDPVADRILFNLIEWTAGVNHQ